MAINIMPEASSSGLEAPHDLSYPWDEWEAANLLMPLDTPLWRQHHEEDVHFRDSSPDARIVTTSHSSSASNAVLWDCMWSGVQLRPRLSGHDHLAEVHGGDARCSRRRTLSKTWSLLAYDLDRDEFAACRPPVDHALAAGKSLLRPRPAPDSEWKQLQSDHSYCAGVLTPAESGDEEERIGDRKQRRPRQRQRSIAAGREQKPAVKDLEAASAESLLLKRALPHGTQLKQRDGADKIKFRLKLKMERPARRQSAARNPFCPPRPASTAPLLSPEKLRESRDLHKSTERQRRVELKRNFDLLKSMLPHLALSDKASKVMVLAEAKQYILQLSTAGRRLHAAQRRHRQRNLALKQRLASLSNLPQPRPGMSLLRPRTLSP